MYLNLSKYVDKAAAPLTSGPRVPPQTPALALISCRMMAKLYTSGIVHCTLYTCTPVHLYLYTSALVVTTSAAAAAGDTSSGRQGAV